MLFPNHDPAAGIIGDCFRCSVASILELPAEDVPHFIAQDWDQPEAHWYAELNKWLAPRGLSYFDMPVPEEHFGPAWFEFIGKAGFDVYHVMCGVGPRGIRHCVVGRNGLMVHDPHPARYGLAGPGEDGYRYGFFFYRGGA